MEPPFLVPNVLLRKLPMADSEERPTPIGERVIEGFGKALRKAVGEAPTAKVHTCFHSNETTESLVEILFFLKT